MNDGFKGVGAVVVFAVMASAAFKLGIVESVGPAFASLCIAGAMGYVIASVHHWWV